MSTITIRNLEPDLVNRLKERAKKNGHSMEQEVREILGKHLVTRMEVLNEIQALHEKIKTPPPSAEEVNEWIAAGRRGRSW